MGYTRTDALFMPGIGEMPGRASSFIGAGVGGVLVTLLRGAPTQTQSPGTVRESLRTSLLDRQLLIPPHKERDLNMK